MEIVGALVALVEMMSTPITKCWKYHRHIDEYMETLNEKLEELNSRKEDRESRMKAELLPWKRPKKEAELWLDRVEKINGEILTIQQEFQRKHLSRACLGSTILKKIQQIDKLYQKGDFLDGLVETHPHSGDQLPMPNTFLVRQTSFNKKIEEIWTCLMDDGVRKIGVYGMGGIGKTTAAKTINNRLLTEKDKFENVIWVTVPDPSSIFKLQDAIARKLKVDLSEEYGDETTRAEKLYAELSKRRRYVIILDDLWEAYHLEDVGIPEPSLKNGCKLVLTTRSYDVSRRMHCKSIKMELLSKDETLKLFLDKVGHDVLCVPNLKAIMLKVAEECACLPLAIITVAGSLIGIVDYSEWKIALEELKMSSKWPNGTGSVVLEKLKFSYNRLRDNKLQNCLLYCALYPKSHDIERMDFIEFLIDEGIIEGMKDRQLRVCEMSDHVEKACKCLSTGRLYQ